MHSFKGAKKKQKGKTKTDARSLGGFRNSTFTKGSDSDMETISFYQDVNRCYACLKIYVNTDIFLPFFNKTELSLTFCLLL